MKNVSIQHSTLDAYGVAHITAGDTIPCHRSKVMGAGMTFTAKSSVPNYSYE